MTDVGNNFDEFDWDLWSYAGALEKEWVEYSRLNYPGTPQEFVETFFPERTSVDREYIHEKLIELNQFLGLICSKYYQKKKLLKQVDMNETQKMVWNKLVDMEYQLVVKRVRSKRYFLESIKNILGGFTHIKDIKNEQWYLRVYEAKAVPIEFIYPQNYKKLANRLTGLCPLHKEKTGSFVIYLKSNTYYCFGCNQGGDVIDLVRRINNFNFREAVECLLSK